MRKRRLKKRKRQRKIIIISLIAFLFIMMGGYAAFQTNLNIRAKGNIVEKSRVIQSWSSTSNEDFHTNYYRKNIVNVTFLDDARVPSNAAESWDVSESKDKGVMAYVIPNSEDNTKYDLYIGANGGVVANEQSNHFFYDFYFLKSVEFNDNFDTKNTLNLAGFFQNCKSLTAVDLSSFDTSNVTDMFALFSMWGYREAGTSLKEINLSGWDTSNVIDMRDMFAYNSNLSKIVGLENFSGF